MIDYGRASDGDGNWVELHGLTSIFGMDYGFMRLDCVQSRFFPLPCLAHVFAFRPKICSKCHTQSDPSRSDDRPAAVIKNYLSEAPLFLYDEPFQAGRLD